MHHTCVARFLLMAGLLAQPTILPTVARAGMCTASRPQEAAGSVTIDVSVGGAPLPAAAVVALPGYAFAATDSTGRASLSLSPGSYSVCVSATYDGRLCVGRNDSVAVRTGTATSIRVSLRSPAQKPPSTGPVRISGRQIQIGGKPWQARGVGYEPFLISTGPGFRPATDAVYRRDFPQIAGMWANTIRTWGPVDDILMTQANRCGLRVLAGYWLEYTDDFSDAATRSRILADWRKYVNKVHSQPALLGFGIGNENNYHVPQDKIAYLYSLVNEMAYAAFDEEGPGYHPTVCVNGELGSIGQGQASDLAMNYIDIWALNVYRGRSMGSLFSDYEARSVKPCLISEYGNDAYDHRRNAENDSLQAWVDTSLWNEIDAARGACAGAYVMAFIDQYWKYGSDPTKHIPGGFRQPTDMDGIADENWWGLFAVEKDPAGGIDRIRPRKAVAALTALWKKAALRNSSAAGSPIPR